MEETPLSTAPVVPMWTQSRPWQVLVSYKYFEVKAILVSGSTDWSMSSNSARGHVQSAYHIYAHAQDWQQ